MNDLLYKMYANARRMIEEFEKEEEKDEPLDVRELLESWRGTVEVLEISRPEFKSTYDRRQAVQKSFTYQQIDHICYMIGDWYIEWEKKMWVDGKPNEHWLGVAKEQLKTMICGD